MKPISTTKPPRWTINPARYSDETQADVPGVPGGYNKAYDAILDSVSRLIPQREKGKKEAGKKTGKGQKPKADCFIRTYENHDV